MSQLSRFRDLLSQIEQEYISLLQDSSGVNNEVIDQSYSNMGDFESDGANALVPYEMPSDIGLDDVVPKEIELDRGVEEVAPMDIAFYKGLEDTIPNGIHNVTEQQNGDQENTSAPEVQQLGSARGSMLYSLVDVGDAEVCGFAEGLSRKTSLHSAHSIRTSSSDATTFVFPNWWNPDVEDLKRLSSARSSNAVLSFVHDQEEVHRVFSPLSFPKLHWDFLGSVLLLYVAWAMPFQIVFGTATNIPLWMNIVDVAITTFFSLDVILNFNTGFVDQGRVIRNRRKIILRYSKGC